MVGENEDECSRVRRPLWSLAQMGGGGALALHSQPSLPARSLCLRHETPRTGLPLVDAEMEGLALGKAGASGLPLGDSGGLGLSLGGGKVLAGAEGLPLDDVDSLGTADWEGLGTADWEGLGTSDWGQEPSEPTVGSRAWALLRPPRFAPCDASGELRWVAAAFPNPFFLLHQKVQNGMRMQLLTTPPADHRYEPAYRIQP
jgi:hypothetical protein